MPHPGFVSCPHRVWALRKGHEGAVQHYSAVTVLCRCTCFCRGAQLDMRALSLLPPFLFFLFGLQGCFNGKDFLNSRYHAKRFLYLLCLKRALEGEAHRIGWRAWSGLAQARATAPGLTSWSPQSEALPPDDSIPCSPSTIHLGSRYRVQSTLYPMKMKEMWSRAWGLEFRLRALRARVDADFLFGCLLSLCWLRCRTVPLFAAPGAPARRLGHL